MIRKKHADADLNAIYPKVLRHSTSLTLFLMVGTHDHSDPFQAALN